MPTDLPPPTPPGVDWTKLALIIAVAIAVCAIAALAVTFYESSFPEHGARRSTPHSETTPKLLS